MDGMLVQNSSLMGFEIGDLSPWSLHSFRVQACTAQGCALGPLVRVHHIYIMLMPPLRVRWQLNIIKVIDSLCSIKHLLLTLDIGINATLGWLLLWWAIFGHFSNMCAIFSQMASSADTAKVGVSSERLSGCGVGVRSIWSFNGQMVGEKKCRLWCLLTLLQSMDFKWV